MIEKPLVESPKARRTFWEVATSEKYFKWFLIGPILLLLAVFMFYPLIYALYYSIQSYVAGGEAAFIGLGNFRAALHSGVFWTASARTFYILAICITVELTVGMAVALLLNREFKGQNVVRGLCLLPLLAAPLHMSMEWWVMLRPTGIVNMMLSTVGIPPVDWFSSKLALYSIMMMQIWQWIPFSVFVLLAGLKSMPKDVFEAARVDGARGWYIFRRLTLPMLSPLILIIILLRTMWLIRIFDPLFGTTRGGIGTETLDWYLYRINFYYFNIGQGSTLALIALFITIVICALLYRRLMIAMGLAK